MVERRLIGNSKSGVATYEGGKFLGYETPESLKARLPQALNPNERGVAVYHKGQFMGFENVKTVTAEEQEERLEAEARELAIAEITAQKKAELQRLRASVA